MNKKIRVGNSRLFYIAFIIFKTTNINKKIVVSFLYFISFKEILTFWTFAKSDDTIKNPMAKTSDLLNESA